MGIVEGSQLSDRIIRRLIRWIIRRIIRWIIPVVNLPSQAANSFLRSICVTGDTNLSPFSIWLDPVCIMAHNLPFLTCELRLEEGELTPRVMLTTFLT